jgi:hypothetical protein
MVEQHGKTPAEFTKDMPEDDPAHGAGAGPGAPETDEPRTGRPSAGGHGPDAAGPGGAGMQRPGEQDDAADADDGAG